MEKCLSCRFYIHDPLDLGDIWSPHRCTRFLTCEEMPLTSSCQAELVERGRCPDHKYWKRCLRWYEKAGFWLLDIDPDKRDWWEEG